MKEFIKVYYNNINKFTIEIIEIIDDDVHIHYIIIIEMCKLLLYYLLFI